MGNPSRGGCGPDQSPMALPKGLLSTRHRQSRSISSLPLDNLLTSSSNNGDVRSSVSAYSSPARPALGNSEVQQKRQSIANILGHASSPSRLKPTNTKLASEPDRKPSSFHPFRGTSRTSATSAASATSGPGTSGHRRVGSGSSIPSKPTWEYSPRARFGGGGAAASSSSCSSSAAASPKNSKLDKYAVARIAASLFHAPSKKLERSLSLSLSSKKKQRNHGLKVGEVILSQNLAGKVVTPFSQRAAGDGGGGLRTTSPCNGPMEESAISQAPQQNLATDITKPAEVAGEPPVQDSPPVKTEEDKFFETTAEILSEDSCRSSPEGMWTSSSASPAVCIAASVEERNPSRPSDLGDLRLYERVGGYESGLTSSPLNVVCHMTMEVQDLENLTNIQQPHGNASDKITTEEELTEAALRCSIAASEGDDDRSPLPVTAGAGAEEEEGPSHEQRGRTRFRMSRRAASAPRVHTKHEEVGSTSGGKKTKVRKRRRSVSASGVGAMLLRVVQVPESGVIVTKRLAKSGDGEEQAWRRHCMQAPVRTAAENAARRSVVRDACDARDARDAPVVSDTAEPEDAVKAIYSKFVNIEIDPRHKCVELEQHVNDISQDDDMDSIDWDGQPQQEQRMLGSSPKHLPPVNVNSSSVYDGKTEARKTKTIRRGRMKFYNEDGLKEYLKVADSFAALAQADTTTDEPAAAAAAEATAAAEAAAAPEAAPLPPLPPTRGSNRSIRERSLTFVSRLQAPSTATSSYVDAYQQCSVSVLTKSSVSSTYQDKLWEEQAEFFSGRRTPGRIWKAQGGQSPQSSLLYKLQRSPQPDFGSPHHVYNNPAVGKSGLNGMRSPSESGHFMQQIMSRIRGSSPKRSAGSCPKTQLDISKRRNPWSSCMCFSVKS